MERNRRSKKSNLTFAEYCSLIDELLKLTGRKIKPRPALKPDTFKL